MKKLLNPVAHFDERKLLVVGLASVVLNLAIGYFFDLRMVSVLKFAPVATSFDRLVLFTLRAYLVAIAVFYLYGWLINRKTRFLDVVNAVLISTIPGMLVCPFQRIPFFSKTLERMLENPQEAVPSDMTILMLFAVLMLPFVIYQIVLLFNDFKTATHMKAWYHVFLFFVLLLSTAFFTPFIFKL